MSKFAPRGAPDRTELERLAAEGRPLGDTAVAALPAPRRDDVHPRGSRQQPCKRCKQDRVSVWRRRVKAKLVEEAGGRCALCGYDRCQAALQFHHRDRSEKLFAISHQGLTRSITKAREEARKCVLVCANCHAELKGGYRKLEAAPADVTHAS